MFPEHASALLYHSFQYISIDCIQPLSEGRTIFGASLPNAQLGYGSSTELCRQDDHTAHGSAILNVVAVQIFSIDTVLLEGMFEGIGGHFNRGHELPWERLLTSYAP